MFLFLGTIVSWTDRLVTKMSKHRDKIIRRVLPMLNAKLKTFEMQEMKSGSVTASDIKVVFSHVGPENIQIEHPSNSKMIVTVSDLSSEGSMGVLYNTLVARLKGKLLWKVKVSKASFVVHMNTVKGSQVAEVEFVKAEIDHDNFSVTPEFDYIPQLVSATLVKLFKGTIINKINDFVSHFIKSNSSKHLNELVATKMRALEELDEL